MKPISLELMESVDGGKGVQNKFGSVEFDLGELAFVGANSDQRLPVVLVPSVQAKAKSTGTPILTFNIRRAFPQLTFAWVVASGVQRACSTNVHSERSEE